LSFLRTINDSIRLREIRVRVVRAIRVLVALAI
jgi:hypothetical protein